MLITLSLCLSPIPKTYVATQYPAQDIINRLTASLKSSSVGLLVLIQAASGSLRNAAVAPPAA